MIIFSNYYKNMNFDKIYVDTLIFYFKFLSLEPMSLRRRINVLCDETLCYEIINNIKSIILSGLSGEKVNAINVHIIINEYLLSIFDYHNTLNNINSTHEKKFNELFPMYVKLNVNNVSKSIIISTASVILGCVLISDGNSKKKILELVLSDGG